MGFASTPSQTQNAIKLRAWRAKNPGKNTTYCLKWQAKNPEKVLDWQSRNRDKIKVYKRKSDQRLKRLGMTKTWRMRLKMEVLRAYGSTCACCGESNPYFLTVDHIKNDGAAHRRAISANGTPVLGSAFYKWLKANGYPKDNIQLLCFNCNCAKQCLGACPHEAVGSLANLFGGR